MRRMRGRVPCDRSVCHPLAGGTLDLQPKLLRVLENRCFRRVGGTPRPPARRPHRRRHQPRSGAPSSPAAQFREDLYFRLAAAVVSCRRCASGWRICPFLVGALLEDLGPRRPGRPQGDRWRVLARAPLARQRARAQERARLGPGLRRRRARWNRATFASRPAAADISRSTACRWAATRWRASSEPPSARPCARPAATRPQAAQVARHRHLDALREAEEVQPPRRLAAPSASAGRLRSEAARPDRQVRLPGLRPRPRPRSAAGGRRGRPKSKRAPTRRSTPFLVLLLVRLRRAPAFWNGGGAVGPQKSRRQAICCVANPDGNVEVVEPRPGVGEVGQPWWRPTFESRQVRSRP